MLTISIIEFEWDHKAETGRGMNKNRTAEYFWPDEQTKGPNLTGRPNFKHFKNPPQISNVLSLFNMSCNTEYKIVMLHVVIYRVDITLVHSLVIWSFSVFRFSIHSVLRSKIRSSSFLFIRPFRFGLLVQFVEYRFLWQVGSFQAFSCGTAITFSD